MRKTIGQTPLGHGASCRVAVGVLLTLVMLAEIAHGQGQTEGPGTYALPGTVMSSPPPAQGVVPRHDYGSSPFSDYGVYGEGDCCGCDEGCFQWNPGLWVEADVLLWWRSGQNLPPLVTTSPAGTNVLSAGILPAATILYGNGEAGSRMHVGGRIDAGLWFDSCNMYGVGVRYTTLGNDTSVFNLSSADNTIIGRPFFDLTVNGGSVTGQNAFLVAHPQGGPLGETTTGSITVTTTSQVQSTDFYYRHNVRNDGFARLDLIAGYQTSAINEDLSISSTTNLNGTFTVTDRFQTRNEFNGAVLGLISKRDYGCWELDLLAKVAFGTTREQVFIQGERSPTPANGNPNSGLYAVGTNSGLFTQHDFCVTPEIALKAGYRVSPNMTLTVGYSAIYFSTVVRPGDQIDQVINPTQIDGTLAGEARPTFRFQNDDFWAQGVNLGVRWDY